MDANIVCNTLGGFRQSAEHILSQMRRFSTASPKASWKVCYSCYTICNLSDRLQAFNVEPRDSASDPRTRSAHALGLEGHGRATDDKNK